jgi:hypothetical protein
VARCNRARAGVVCTRGTTQWCARQRLDADSPTVRCCRRPRGGHRGGTGQGGGGRGAPERCADGEAARMVSGGGVQRRRGSSGGRQQAWRGPAARGRPVGLGGGGQLWNGAARRALTGRGRTAATLGRSLAQRRGSGGGKPVKWTPGRWVDECATLGRGRMRRTTRRGEKFGRRAVSLF